MNLSNPEHVKRLTTGVIGVIAIVTLYYYLRHFAVQLFCVVVAMIAYYEYLNILISRDNSPKFRSTKITASLIAALVYFLPISHSSILAFGLLMLFTLMLYRYWELDPNSIAQHGYHLHDLFVSTFGLVYIIGFLSFLPEVHRLEKGPIWTLMLFGIIWIGDSAAYYGGQTFGKHKLAVVLSPGKTFEGAVSGALGSILWSLAVRQIWLPEFPISRIFFLALITAIISQLGDLFESMLKRVVGVKDSGSFLPGHGGMLDRFDSLIIACPFYYYLIRVYVV